MNQIYSNGLKFIFLGHSCFRVIHWETIITKVHSQTLMAMKSGCKMYTHKCYVTLEWPLMLHFKHSLIGCVAHYLGNVPSENNYARESALKMLFREQKCPFSSSSTMPFFNPGQNTVPLNVILGPFWQCRWSPGSH